MRTPVCESCPRCPQTMRIVWGPNGPSPASREQPTAGIYNCLIVDKPDKLAPRAVLRSVASFLEAARRQDRVKTEARRKHAIRLIPRFHLLESQNKTQQGDKHIIELPANPPITFGLRRGKLIIHFMQKAENPCLVGSHEPILNASERYRKNEVSKRARSCCFQASVAEDTR